MIKYQTIPVPRPEPRCIRSVTERMADDMREMAFADEAVNPENLAAHGYPAEVVRKIGAQAVEMARRGAVRQMRGR